MSENYEEILLELLKKEIESSKQVIKSYEWQAQVYEKIISDLKRKRQDKEPEKRPVMRLVVCE